MRRSRIRIIWMLVTVMILTVFSACARGTDHVRVQWRDEAVHHAAAAALGKKPEGAVFFDEIGGITALVVESQDTVDLTDLSGLPNLQSVDLSGAIVSDATPLLSCARLQTLIVGDEFRYAEDQIEILEHLQENIPETDIDVDKHYWSMIPVSFTDPVINANVRAACGRSDGVLSCADIRGIRSLKIEGETVSHPEELGKLFRLKELTLKNCGITETGWVSSVPQLLLLNLDDNALPALSGIGSLTQLQALSLNGNCLTDISCVGELNELFALSVNGNPLSDPSQITLATKLTNLSAMECGIRDIGFLRDMPQLQVIWLNDNSISDLEPLAGLMQLKVLGLTSNQIRSVDALSGLTEMTDLYLANNNISDITALSGMGKLERLQLTMNNVFDIAPIIGLSNLNEISLLSNPVLDYGPLLELNRDWTKIDIEPQLAADACKTASGLAQEIMAETQDEKQRVQLAHDRIVLLTKYDYDAAESGDLGFEVQSAYAALLRGRSVCVGYAESLVMILRDMGIEAYIVNGKAAGVEHAWVVCRAGGDVVYVDPTWDDPDQGSLIYRDYLLADAQTMREDHEWNETLFRMEG